MYVHYTTLCEKLHTLAQTFCAKVCNFWQTMVKRVVKRSKVNTDAMVDRPVVRRINSYTMVCPPVLVIIHSLNFWIISLYRLTNHGITITSFILLLIHQPLQLIVLAARPDTFKNKYSDKDPTYFDSTNLSLAKQYMD